MRILTIVAALAVTSLGLPQRCPAQDRPLGDVARETRSQNAQSKPARTLTNDGPEPITADDDPIKVVTQAATAMLRDHSHRCHELSSGNSGPGWTKDNTTEIAGDDRMRLILNQDNQHGEVIFIGNEGYRKTGSAPWARMDPRELNWYQTYAPNAMKLPDELKFGYKPGDLKLIGPEVIGGIATFHYRMKIEGVHMQPHGVGIDRTIDIWVGVSDSLPRRTEMTTRDLEVGTSWHTTTECTYGVEIKIEAPR